MARTKGIQRIRNAINRAEHHALNMINGVNERCVCFLGKPVLYHQSIIILNEVTSVYPV